MACCHRLLSMQSHATLVYKEHTLQGTAALRALQLYKQPGL